MSSGSSARRLLAALIVGLILGATLAATGAARRLETLRLDRDRALQDNLQLQGELERLRREVNSGRGCRIAQVEVLVAGDGPGVDQGVLLEVERRAEQRSRHWVGMPCASVHPLAVVTQFQGRFEEIGDRLFRLQHLSTVVGPHTVVQLLTAAPPATGGQPGGAAGPLKRK